MTETMTRTKPVSPPDTIDHFVSIHTLLAIPKKQPYIPQERIQKEEEPEIYKSQLGSTLRRVAGWLDERSEKREINKKHPSEQLAEAGKQLRSIGHTVHKGLSATISAINDTPLHLAKLTTEVTRDAAIWINMHATDKLTKREVKRTDKQKNVIIRAKAAAIKSATQKKERKERYNNLKASAYKYARTTTQTFFDDIKYMQAEKDTAKQEAEKRYANKMRTGAVRRAQDAYARRLSRKETVGSVVKFSTKKCRQIGQFVNRTFLSAQTAVSAGKEAWKNHATKDIDDDTLADNYEI